MKGRSGAKERGQGRLKHGPKAEGGPLRREGGGAGPVRTPSAMAVAGPPKRGPKKKKGPKASTR
jgi:hypothetical protein